MLFRSSPVVAVLLFLLASPVVAQSFDDVEMKATHVAGSVYMLEGRGGNIGVSVGKDGILIVDDQFAELADKIRAALGEIGKGKLRFVLNTHYHGDHTGANPVFGVEATIVAHDNVRRRLLEPQQSPGGTRVMDPAGLPVITYGESVTFHFNGEEIRVFHVPSGHTDGDSIVHFTGSNVVHMGDQMFSGRFPFIDLEAGGTVEGYVTNIERVLERIAGRDDVKIIPGHGPLSSPADLQALHDMIEETSVIVAHRVAEGKSLEAIQEEGLPEEYAAWDWRFIGTNRWLETLHATHAKR
jgi:cyclase